MLHRAQRLQMHGGLLMFISCATQRLNESGEQDESDTVRHPSISYYQSDLPRFFMLKNKRTGTVNETSLTGWEADVRPHGLPRILTPTTT